MNSGFRDSGLSVIGDCRWGTHCCMFYRTREDLREVLVPYFKAGLESNESCLWITSEPLNADDACRALRDAMPDLDACLERGQIEILDYRQWYTKSGVFNSERVLAGWVEKANHAVDRGFAGLRVSGNTFWLEAGDWSAFVEYEASVDAVVECHPIIALCTYSLERCGAAEIADVVAHHQFALLRREGSWQRITSASQTRAQQTSHEAETRYRALFEQSPDGVLVIDPETLAPVEFNDAAHRQLGYTRAEFAKLRIVDFEAVERTEETRAHVVRIVREGADDFETLHRTKDGEPRNVHATAKRIELAGRPFLLCLFRDITERKQIEYALRRAHRDLEIRVEERTAELTAANAALATSEERFRSIAQSTPDAIIVADHHGTIIFWNQAARAMFQYTPEEVLGTHLIRLVPEDCRPRHVQAIAEYARTGQSHLEGQVSEMRGLRKDGQEIPIEISTCSWKSGGERFVGTIIRDVTHRKRMENRLRASEASLAEAQRIAHLGNWDWDIQTNDLRWSDEIYRIFGLAPQEFGATYDEFLKSVHPEDRELVTGAVWRALFGKKPYCISHRIVRPDGSERIVHERAEVFHASDGSPIRMIGTVQDITEREGIERRLSAELEKRVRERTAKLEAANQELEAFVHTVSHDLRAPLRAIDGYIRILGEERANELSDDANQVLATIRNRAQQMDRLICGLLEFARLDHFPLHKLEVAPKELVRQALGDLSAELKDRGVQFSVGDLPICQADPILLKQVFVNLLSNALKFSRPRDPAQIEVGFLDRNGERIYFVKDNGVGFDREDARNLFGVFQRLHRADEFEGIGVGLANVQRIIRRHGGRIWAESELGKGATFYFTLGGDLIDSVPPSSLRATVTEALSKPSPS